MCAHEHPALDPDNVAAMQARPEFTLGDLRRIWADLPDETVLRVDAGWHFTPECRPEHVGLVSAARAYRRSPGNDVRIFGLSEPGEGVVWLEL
jgi:hypothetical protein